MRRVLAFLFVAWALPASAMSLSGIEIAGYERLPASNASRLADMLRHLPLTFYPQLQLITVDNAPLTPEQQALTCVVPWLQYLGPCRVNIFADASQIEYPFPADAPDTVSTTTFEQVVAHEIGHQIAVYMDQYRGGLPWQTDLIAEAGCEPSHYLRSMLPPCYFRDNPQEWFASMMNQWIACSDCVLQLALSRWRQGNPHPLNAAIYLIAVMGRGTFVEGLEPVGSVHAYYQSLLEPWTVRPWRCGGESEIVTEARTVRLVTDNRCRVTTLLGD